MEEQGDAGSTEMGVMIQEGSGCSICLLLTVYTRLLSV